MEISVKLRKIRKAYGWKLRDVAGRTELSISYLSDIERSRTTPSLKTCQKLADCYLMNLSQLLEEVSVPDEVQND